MMRVKRNDTVVILSGKDKGKRGKILVIDPKKNQVLVKDVAISVKHAKARGQEKAGIRKKESAINLSKVMPICSSCDKASRINIKITDDGKVRICGHCEANLG